MKAALLNDEDVTLSALPAGYQSKLSFRPGNPPVPYFKKGTEFEGDHALFLVRNGQASPSDEECRVACGLTPDQLRKVGLTHAAALAGIVGDKDRTMFLAGAITGYGPGSTEENPVYVKGPNWDAWQEAAGEVAAKVTQDPL